MAIHNGYRMTTHMAISDDQYHICHLGSSGNHLGSIWESFGIYLGAIWEAPCNYHAHTHIYAITNRPYTHKHTHIYIYIYIYMTPVRDPKLVLVVSF
jgi:hypothetical protein